MIRSRNPGRFRLSAHLGYLFADLPILQRFDAARRAGFRTIEIADPYGFSASEFRALCVGNGLNVAQIALPNGVSPASAKGFAALPDREAEFDLALSQAIEFAKVIDCPLIHPMAGTRSPLEPAPDWAVYCSNIAKACTLAADEGLGVIIEPISTYSARNYFMNSLQLACATIDQVDAPNLRMSFDTYHAAAMAVPIPQFIARHIAQIGHVQIADWPHRHEPGTGELDFDAIFGALSAGRYQGGVGLEYVLSREGDANLEWTSKFVDYLEPLDTPKNF